MVRKLELEALANDLGAVQTLLSRRTPDSDPIGYMQFASRLTEIEQSIHELAATPQNKASLAMFFAGEPVQGSRGVNADFAGRAIGLFQDLVSKQFASTERGSLAQTGPVPMKSNSDMLLTNIARGSVGLILEEADRNDSLTESELAVAVRKVATDIVHTTQADATAFEELIEDVDSRYFASLGALFKLFDDSHSTVRLVESAMDVQLDAPSIHRGRERTDAAIIDDDDGVELQGRLFLLPATRKFELALTGEGETIHGNVSREFASAHLEAIHATDDVVNRDWVVRVMVRTIKRPSKAALVKYTLCELVHSVAPAN